ncbi:MAG: PadR family transcriptional regulator [Hyphomonadaceae bacterium]
MARQSNISKQTQAVIHTLLSRPQDWFYGYELMDQTSIASGTLYPMLMRLCDQGYLEAKWVPSPHRSRPPRHAYRLTSSGLALGRRLAVRHGILSEVEKALAT